MVIFPSGLVLLGLWLVVMWRSADRGVALAIMLLPFGMFAAMQLPIGGLTPLSAPFIAGLTTGVFMLVAVRQRLKRPLTLPAAALPLLLLSIYAVFSATVLVRTFADDIVVFSFERDAVGDRVSPFFPAQLSVLQPNSANLSQTAYLLLSIAFFIVLMDVIRRRGVSFLVGAVRWAAILNLVLGLIDYVGLEVLLEPVRTANYALLNMHTIAGVPRAIGGFSEASAFGGFSAIMAGFMLTYGHIRKNRTDLLIGAANAAFALLALSTSAFLGLAAVGLFFFVRALRPLVAAIDQRDAYGIIFVICALTAAFAFVIGSNMLGDLPMRVLDTLIFSKADSESGLERGAMAAQGFQTFLDTGGLGAGVGSARANGYLSAMLAAMGLPGLLLFLWFVKLSFFDGSAGEEVTLRASRRAAQCGAFVMMTGMLGSSFSVDPGLDFMAFAAIALGARAPEWQAQEAPA